MKIEREFAAFEHRSIIVPRLWKKTTFGCGRVAEIYPGGQLSVGKK
jgi:hypothetical protein